jgi:hypothetical protein
VCQVGCKVTVKITAAQRINGRLDATRAVARGFWAVMNNSSSGHPLFSLVLFLFFHLKITKNMFALSYNNVCNICTVQFAWNTYVLTMGKK